ncbi:MAG TPA: methyl-accepting chemotaxis protein [Trinickia sp.]|jgi:methyl-accepting chemotaxis protein|uniref:methyl-accepting chemotaxis protein n=1 Tax=Trinickia sp. TaxID=2571163 RepID=UPI002B517C71|nr:methyl-accepting chemotaxis protein [Trinickia sp.]HTI16678.1 methyl-accepting chemotaxis protein [Trinickia sp.]
MESTDSLLLSIYIKADRLMLAIVWALFVVACLLAARYYAWPAVFTIGLPTTLIASALVLWRPGSLATRLFLAASLMIFAALHIHEERGLVELHFGIFVFMAFLLAYRDWRPIVCAALVIAVHHLSFNYLQLGGFDVYCFTQPALSTVILHAAYVVAEAALLVYIAWQMKRDARTARELALLSENLSREKGRFDLRFAPMALEGRSSQTFKQTLDAIHSAMREITATIEGIASSSHEIAAGNQNLSKQIEAQADTLKTTNTTMGHIASRVRESAAGASRANGLARQTATVAQQSGQVVAEVIAKIGDIDDAVHRMGDMITTIEGIAFQTNILALNASIEAARVGPEGRGFAVVAGEVRALAQRSANAAHEIKALIADSLQHVEDGSTLASHAGETMRNVMGQVGEVAQLVDDISATSEAQSRDLDEFSDGISQIDHMLGRDVAHVQGVACASGHLREQAQALRDAMAVFLLERGA